MLVSVPAALSRLAKSGPAVLFLPGGKRYSQRPWWTPHESV